MKVRRKFIPLPPLHWIRSILDYDLETGIFTWKVDRRNGSKAGAVAGYVSKRGYRRIWIDGVRHTANRLAWYMATGQDPGELEVDHIHGNAAGDGIANLRLATKGQNQGNRRGAAKHSTTGIRGVFWDNHRRRFRAQIRVNGKAIYLGYFDDPWTAAAAYNAANRKYFGDRGGVLAVVPEGFRHPETGELMVPPETPVDRWPSTQSDLFNQAS